MDISQFSTRCIFIPPMKNDYVLSQTQQEEIKEKLEKEFNRLKECGIQTVLYIGGMNLDYERYDVSHIIPSVMVYHTNFQYQAYIQSLYTVSTQEITREIELVGERITFLDELIYHDAQVEMYRELEKQYGYKVNPSDFNIEVSTPLLYKYDGEDLLYNWLREQRVLACWGVNKHGKFFKKSFEGNKSGLKFDMNTNDTKYYICGNPLREDIIFSK